MDCKGRKAKMSDNINTRVKRARLTYSTVIQCSKSISEGEISKYKDPLELQVVNISSEGLCISTTEVFKKGTILEFNIVLEDTLYTTLSATIIWSIKAENAYKYGLHIENITGKFSIHIYKMESRLSTNI
ncbi:PilZ domain-containing protein [Candidatus Desulfosporosinus infrequens]|uniref:PilZ domain-containing protein n=1 Tax=Candidatus Desulfosporosinus infrequens TaxID=2043169 RepID=A0A2U3K0L6_9FIRM|nr:PilZ domain-containing protein [Candidatus Desulfosporosinus infrequens]